MQNGHEAECRGLLCLLFLRDSPVSLLLRMREKFNLSHYHFLPPFRHSGDSCYTHFGLQPEVVSDASCAQICKLS